MSDGSDVFDRGMKVRRKILGDAHVDRAEATRTPLNADFQDFLTRYAWGEIWSRPEARSADPELHYGRHAGRAQSPRRALSSTCGPL